MYTFHVSDACVERTYAEICQAYELVFRRLELDVKKAVASVGAMGGSKSHEYHILSDVGEDKIVVCPTCGQAASVDVFENASGERLPLNQQTLCELVKCGSGGKTTRVEEKLEEKRAIECGHTFVLNDRYTKHIPIKIGNHKQVIMGCYGIGVSRLMQVCVEVRL